MFQNVFSTIFQWSQSLLIASTSITSWLITPLWSGGLSPIYLLTFSGLIAYLGIAIVRWFI